MGNMQKQLFITTIIGCIFIIIPMLYWAFVWHWTAGLLCIGLIITICGSGIIDELQK